MTKTQERIIEKFRADILAHDGLGRFVEGYEYKEFKTESDPKTGLVFLVTEVGMKGDEGSLASVLCRTHRHITIKPTGGVSCYRKGANGRWGHVRGYRKVLIFGAQR